MTSDKIYYIVQDYDEHELPYCLETGHNVVFCPVFEDTMMRRAPKDREDYRVRYTRKLLRDSLISLMKERPVTEIGIKEICTRAEVSRSTFYVYYEGIYHLLAEIEDGIMKYSDDMFKQLEDLIKRRRRTFTVIHQKSLEFIADKDNPMQVLLSENGDINFQKRFFQRIISRIRKIMDNATGNPADRYIHEGYSIFIIHGAIGLIQYWLKNNMHIPIPTLTKMLDKLTLGSGF